MTYEEAKDQVAKSRDWSNWNEALVIGSGDELLLICDQAAKLYASSKWDEACNEQRDRCTAQFINSVDVDAKLNQFTAREYCSIAPKPEFKP